MSGNEIIRFTIWRKRVVYQITFAARTYPGLLYEPELKIRSSLIAWGYFFLFLQQRLLIGFEFLVDWYTTRRTLHKFDCWKSQNKFAVLLLWDWNCAVECCRTWRPGETSWIWIRSYWTIPDELTKMRLPIRSGRNWCARGLPSIIHDKPANRNGTEIQCVMGSLMIYYKKEWTS